MKKNLLFLSIIYLCFVFALNAQQVNPFELKENLDNSSIPNRDSQSIDTGDYSIIVIEDSLKQPQIIENNELIPVEVPTEEVNQAAEVKDEPKTKESIIVNPFELLNDDSNEIVVDSIIGNQVVPQDTLQEKDTLNSGNSIVNQELEKKPKPIQNTPVPNDGRNLIVFFACLLCGLLIGLSLNSRKTILADIWKSFRNLNYMKLLQKEQKNGWTTAYIILYAVYLINITFFIRFLCIHYELPLFQYTLWKIGILVLSLLILRHLSLYVLSFMRKRLNETLNYNFIIITVNIITGLLLIPINLFIAYSSPGLAKTALFVGIGIVFISFLTRWFRAFINSLRIIIGDSFHFLLYLCSCEIVPIIIMLGYLRNLIN